MVSKIQTAPSFAEWDQVVLWRTHLQLSLASKVHLSPSKLAKDALFPAFEGVGGTLTHSHLTLPQSKTILVLYWLSPGGASTDPINGKDRKQVRKEMSSYPTKRSFLFKTLVFWIGRFSLQIQERLVVREGRPELCILGSVTGCLESYCSPGKESLVRTQICALNVWGLEKRRLGGVTF